MLTTSIVGAMAQGSHTYYLEAEAEGNYYVWPYDNNGHGGDDFTNTVWPGAKMNKQAGTLSNGHYLYTWDAPVKGYDPTTVIIVKVNNDTDKTEESRITGPYTDPTYYTYIKSATPKHTPSNSNTTYGKRVIYEMNIGSFTSAGTFAAAQAKLSDLKGMGIDIIWLMPIYPRGNSKSPYAVTDFTATNQNYGTKEQLKSFVDAAHALGMDVILDWVPNHAANEHPWVTSNSDYFTKVNGNMVHPNGWLDVYQLDYNNEGLKTAMTNALKGWLTVCGVDGFRFDYVSSPRIPNSYWNEMSAQLRRIKPNVILLAETDLSDGNNNSHVSLGNFDYDYAWGFNDNLRSFGTGSDASTLARYINTFTGQNSTTPIDRMVYLSNHDNNWNGDNVTTNKSMTELWGNNRYLMTVLEFTMPGMPLVYNGQECDGSQKLNYFEDTKIDWSNHSDNNMSGLIRTLASLKHNHVALADGNTQALRGETTVLDQADGVIAYERVNGGKRILVVLNLNNTDKTGYTLHYIYSGKWNLLLSGNNTSYSTVSATATSVLGDMTVTIPAHGYQVYEMTTNNVAGMFFVTEDSWNDNQKHMMTLSGEDSNYKYYTYSLNASDYAYYNDAYDPLYFKFREYVDNGGEVTPRTNYFGAGTNASAFYANTTQIDCTSVEDDGGAAFTLPNPGLDIVSYKITMAQSKSNNNVGYVKVDFFSNGLQPGFYLETPVNINKGLNATNELKWKMDPYDKHEDSDLDLINDETYELCRIVISAADFDNYAGDNTGKLKFRIREFYKDGGNGNLVSNPNYVNPSETEGNDYPFSAAYRQYDDCSWTNYVDGHNFIIEKQTGISSYIIKFWRTANDGSAVSRVRVEYVKEHEYAGNTVENVLESCNNGDFFYLYNVDAKKFMYTGNTWGTMASLLYDDLGIKLKLETGTAVNSAATYALRSTMTAGVTATQGELIGIDDGGGATLDEGYIYCDRDKGNQWVFEPIDEANNIYALKLYMEKDKRWHYILQDRTVQDLNGEYTQVKFIAENKLVGDISTYEGAKWQLIKRSDLIQRLKDQNEEKFVGTNADATFLMVDQGFTRGVGNDTTDKRWSLTKANDDSSFNYTKENSYGGDSPNGKYYNAKITGHGIIYQDVQVPVYGLYRLDLNGYCTGSDTYIFYEYKTAENTWNNGNDWTKYNQAAIEKTAPDTYNALDAGKAFYLNTDHQSTLLLSVPQNAYKDANNNYIIRIGVYHAGKDGYAAVDDVHLHYVGKAPFILDENDGVDGYKVRVDKEIRTHVPVYVLRDFWADKWNALVLPFNVTKKELTDALGGSVSVAKPEGLDNNDAFCINFRSINLAQMADADVVLELGKMYIVKPNKLIYTDEVYKDDGTFVTSNGENEHYYFFGMHDVSRISSLNSTVESTFHNPSDKFSDHNAIEFIGSYSKQTVPAGGYALASDGNMYHLKTAREIDGFRFYIQDKDNDLGQNAAAKLRMFIDNIQEDIVTFVDMVVPTPAMSDDAVYDISGRRVKALTPGLYIKNGKKFVVK